MPLSHCPVGSFVASSQGRYAFLSHSLMLQSTNIHYSLAVKTGSIDLPIFHFHSKRCLGQTNLPIPVRGRPRPPPPSDRTSLMDDPYWWKAYWKRKINSYGTLNLNIRAIRIPSCTHASTLTRNPRYICVNYKPLPSYKVLFAYLLIFIFLFFNVDGVGVEDVLWRNF